MKLKKYVKKEKKSGAAVELCMVILSVRVAAARICERQTRPALSIKIYSKKQRNGWKLNILYFASFSYVVSSPFSLVSAEKFPSFFRYSPSSPLFCAREIIKTFEIRLSAFFFLLSRIVCYVCDEGGRPEGGRMR